MNIVLKVAHFFLIKTYYRNFLRIQKLKILLLSDSVFLLHFRIRLRFQSEQIKFALCDSQNLSRNQKFFLRYSNPIPLRFRFKKDFEYKSAPLYKRHGPYKIGYRDFSRSTNGPVFIQPVLDRHQVINNF